MIAAAALGGAVGLDRTAFGQTLLAHPSVAASLAGWCAGTPIEGIWIGLILGLVTAPRIPVGSERLRDFGSVAVALPFAVGPGQPGWIWGLALCATALLAPIGGWVIGVHRELALRTYERLKASRASAHVLERAHFGLAALHIARGACVVVVFVLALRVLIQGATDSMGADLRETFTLLWSLAPLLGVGALLHEARRSGWTWLVVGLVAGVGVSVWGALSTWS